MRLIKLMSAALLLGIAACGTPQGEFMYASTSPLIDQPTPPFPYNSRFCP